MIPLERQYRCPYYHMKGNRPYFKNRAGLMVHLLYGHSRAAWIAWRDADIEPLRGMNV